MTGKGRLEKLNIILDMLRKNNGTIKFGELYGQFALEHGTTERTFWEYLETLKMGGKIDYPRTYVIAMKENLEIKLLEK